MKHLLNKNRVRLNVNVNNKEVILNEGRIIIMKKLTIELDDKTYEMLEELSKYYNNETGVTVSMEETVKELIIASHYMEIKLKKENK